MALPMNGFELQPVLTGGGLRLRPLVPEDWEALYAAASDPGIWELHPNSDRWQEPVFRGFFADALASRGALVVQDARSGEVIGSSRFDRRRAAPGEVEIGWTFLVRSRWGGATNRELKRLMLRHAFESGLAGVIFSVGEGNLRSRRAVEKIGGRLTDRVPPNATTPHVIYRIDARDFRTGPLA
jgi:RimJ/RimL family protein N-acetyltransferase